MARPFSGAQHLQAARDKRDGAKSAEQLHQALWWYFCHLELGLACKGHCRLHRQLLQRRASAFDSGQLVTHCFPASIGNQKTYRTVRKNLTTTVRGACMQVFFDEIAKRYTQDKIIMMVGGAG